MERVKVYKRRKWERKKKSELLGDDGWAEQAIHGCFVLERLRESELGRTIELQKAGFRRKKNKEGRERTSSGKVALFFLSFRDYHCLIFYFYLFFLQLELFLLILLCLTILSFVNSDLITCLLLLIHPLFCLALLGFNWSLFRFHYVAFVALISLIPPQVSLLV